MRRLLINPNLDLLRLVDFGFRNFELGLSLESTTDPKSEIRNPKSKAVSFFKMSAFYDRK